MGDLKPLGSEKLQGDEKMKRILELTYYNTNNKTQKKNVDFISESVSGVFGIVKEKDGYYVKRGLNESSLDYIGGLFMKNKNRFSSYAEALKRLELLKGQELQEATKYVLKQKAKPEASQESVPMPSADAGMSPSDADMPPSDAEPTVAPEPEMGGDALDANPMGEPTQPEQGKEAKRSDYMSEIQKFSGKLGQSLRDVKEQLESDDIKYTINMILSAIDLKKLDAKDREEIKNRFDFEDDEEIPSSDEDMSSMDDENSVETDNEPSLGNDDEDIDETISKLEKFINSKAEMETNETDLAFGDEVDIVPVNKNTEKVSNDDMQEDSYGYEGDNNTSSDDSVIELDMDEIKSEINKNINNTLSKYFR